MTRRSPLKPVDILKRGSRIKTPAIVAPKTANTGASKNIIGDPFLGKIVSFTRSSLKKS